MFFQLLVDKVKMLMLNCRWTAAARKIANRSVLSETLVILSDSFAADFYTINARQLANRRGKFARKKEKSLSRTYSDVLTIAL